MRSLIACSMLVGALAGAALADDWPQWRGANRDGVWRETGIVEKFSADRLNPLWTAPIGAGYAGPTVANGRVYVMDRLDEPKQIERVHCFDAATGKPLWSHQHDCEYTVSYVAGPRASVTVDRGLAYALGTMGHFHCFDAATGKIAWSKDLNAEYKIRMPIWGIAAAPLVEDELVIVQIGGSSGTCLVAFDRRSGEERWRALEDQASYSSPIITQQAGRRVLVCWTGESVAGLDPSNGKVHWQYPLKATREIISITTPVIDGDRLFVSSFYDGSLMLRLHRDRLEVEPIWRRIGSDEKHTDALHSLISTPLLDGDYVYGVDSYGELRCLDARSGDRVWESDKAVPHNRWSTIHMVKNGRNIWMFNDRGDLIISRLTPDGFQEISRTHLIDPTTEQLRRGNGVCWAHPAYANRHVFARSDKELICASLAQDAP